MKALSLKRNEFNCAAILIAILAEKSYSPPLETDIYKI
jgi:hypothetical protein